MKQKSLISIILISYKNYQYIYEALDSILCQNYPNIEIIISNDCSDDFDKKAIKEYLEKYKKQNIRNIIINNNKKNIGTVKNCNKAIKISKGEYITIFAADDALYNSKVISKLIASFEILPKNELIVTSQTNMYDVRLKKLIQPFISKTNKNKIKELTPEKLFTEMSTQCILPGSGTCYKREIFKKYGYFDEKYVLIEDYSSALKLSRLGIKYNYFDFISIKHRDGGISHGNINGENQVNKQYNLDILNILTNEVLPFTKTFNKKQKNKFLEHYKNFVFMYKYKYKYQNGARYEKIQFVKKYWKNLISSFSQEIYREIIAQLEGKKFKVFLLGVLIYIFSFITKNPNTITTLKYLGLFLIISSTLLIILNFIKKYLFRIISFIKFII